MWRDLVKDIEGSYSPIVEMYGISATETAIHFPSQQTRAQRGCDIRIVSLGNIHESPKCLRRTVASIEKNSHWILNHIKRDTRAAGPVKGLVMGMCSVRQNCKHDWLSVHGGAL